MLQEKDPLPFTYFAVFDGHAGTGAALMAVKLLQDHLQVKIFNNFTKHFKLLQSTLNCVHLQVYDCYLIIKHM